jgi:hypothetical protein
LKQERWLVRARIPCLQAWGDVNNVYFTGLIWSVLFFERMKNEFVEPLLLNESMKLKRVGV